MLVQAAFIPLIFATYASSISPPARTFDVPLTAAAEVEEAADLTGDFDGSGLVRISVSRDSRQICYDFQLTGIATPLMAHIHRGAAHSNGPSVVTLFTGPGGGLRDCLPWTEKWLAAIVADPAGFYVNISTTEFPDGALRGQLAS